MINHAWRSLLRRTGVNLSASVWYQRLGWLVTFNAVVFAWVYFRAPTLEKGNTIILAMLGASGFEVPKGILARVGEFSAVLEAAGVESSFGGGAVLMTNFLWILFAGSIALLIPNVAQLFSKVHPVLYENDNVFRDIRSVSRMRWRYSNRWAFAIAVAAVAGVLTLQQVSEFLYFQF